VVGLKCVLPGAALGFGLVRRLPVAVTTLVTALVNLLGVVILLWVLSPAGMGPIAYLERQVAAQVTELEQWPARIGAAGQDACAFAVGSASVPLRKRPCPTIWSGAPSGRGCSWRRATSHWRRPD
jgi:hypothetical protein